MGPPPPVPDQPVVSARTPKPEPATPLPPFTRDAAAHAQPYRVGGPDNAPPRVERAGTSTWSRLDDYRSPEQLSVANVRRTETGPRAGARDPRGAFAAACAAVLAGSTLLAWYLVTVTFAAGVPLHRAATIYHAGYRGWHLFIPAVALVGVVIGIVNYFLRPTDNWAVTVFVLLRVLALACVALMVLALVFRHPTSVHTLIDPSPTAGAHPAPPVLVQISLRWPVWVGLGAAVVMLLSTLSSRFSNKD